MTSARSLENGLDSFRVSDSLNCIDKPLMSTVAWSELLTVACGEC